MYEEVEFKTVDEVTLRGWLFPTKSRGVGVVMSPGFNATKEMIGLPSVALAFQAAGVTALLYDPRGVGTSDGKPRNNINPFQQIDDMSDALTFLSSRPSVDPRKGVGLWGFSLGAAVAMGTAAIDPRAKFVVAVCPGTETSYDMPKLRQVLAKAAKDRESRVKGNDAFYVPMLTKQGASPVGWNPGFEHDAIMRLLHTQDESDPLRAELAPGHVNRTTVETYRHMLLWDVKHACQYITQPILFLLAEHDQVVPVERQMVHYETLPGPKRVHVEEGTKHMDILDGMSSENVNKVQIGFVNDAIEGKVMKS
uniref:Thiohydrolase n=1 Tax=Preussia typharum TaxID=718249 RepID=A0A8A0XYJ1_9PLEO|nr:thiohydrolase [Preussia typharum]